MASIKKGKEPKTEKEIDRDEDKISKAISNAISSLSDLKSKDFKSVIDFLKIVNDSHLKGLNAYEKLHEKLIKDAFQTINKMEAVTTKNVMNDLKIQEQKIENEII